MNITRSVKNALRPLRDIIFSIFGFLYDFRRFYRFGGWRASLNNSVQRNYKAVKVYHSLEKSLYLVCINFLFIPCFFIFVISLESNISLYQIGDNEGV